MEKILGIIFLFFAAMTIYDGGVFIFFGIPMQVEGGYRYFYAVPNILIGIYLLVKKKEVELEVYGCQKCDIAFWETDIKDDCCPDCGGKMINIKEIPKYTTVKKEMETNEEDEITKMIRERWEM